MRAAELTPPGRFQRVLFLSSKSVELTGEGPRPLTNFVVPPQFQRLLGELAKAIGVAEEFERTDEGGRAAMLQRALQKERALIVFDNLENLPEDHRYQVFDFLSRLPRGCKAIVTSRRRQDLDARILRLDRLGQQAALLFINELARDREVLRAATLAERIELYNETGGNPLLIRWIATQLGYGELRTVAEAVSFLHNAPPGNDPLEFVFGDLLGRFTVEEEQCLAVLSHFVLSITVDVIAELTGLDSRAAENALERLASRALVVNVDSEGRRYTVTALVSVFLRRARPQTVQHMGARLQQRALQVIAESGFGCSERFPLLDEAWPVVAAAMPVLLTGDSAAIHMACRGLREYCDSRRRWDELLSLLQKAEGMAVAQSDWNTAGWDAFETGMVHYARKNNDHVVAAAERAASHWMEFYRQSGATHWYACEAKAELVEDLRMSGGALVERPAEEEYSSGDAKASGDDLESEFYRSAEERRQDGDLDGADADYQRAWSLATEKDSKMVVANCISGLAMVELGRQNWGRAESLAREAMDLSLALDRREHIGVDYACLSKALLQLGHSNRAFQYAQKAVDVLTEFKETRSLDLAWAKTILDECLKRVKL